MGTRRGLRIHRCGCSLLALALAGAALPGGAARAQSVTATGSIWPGEQATPVPSWSTPWEIIVGYTADGTMTVLNGGTVSGGSGYVGYSSGTEGSVTVSGASSSWTASGRMDVGMYGKGTLVIENGGKATSHYSSSGHMAGSEGRILVTGTESEWSGYDGFAVGLSGDGSFRVEAGATASGRYAVVGENYGAIGTVEVEGAGSRWDNRHEIYLGQSGRATMTISDGGQVTSRDAIIGRYSSGNGSAEITGAGSSWTTTGAFELGSSGTGALAVRDGGAVGSANARIGHGYGAAGEAEVTGSGSTWTNAGALEIGAAGRGALTIADSGVVETDSLWIASGYYSTGVLNIGVAADKAADKAGRLSAASVAFGAGAGSIVFNHTDADYAFDTEMLGTGKVTALAGVTRLTAASYGFTGLVDVAGGTLALSGAGSIAAASGLAVGAAGTFDVSAITAAGTGIGTLSGAGTVALGTKNLTIDQAGDALFSGVFSGSGDLVKDGDGWLVLGGVLSDFGGSVTVLGGGLGIGTGGRLDAGIGVASGAVLAGTGSVGAVTIAAGGRHTPGTSIGSQTVNGAYVNGGILEIEVASGGVSDRIVANGTVDVSGGTLRVLSLPGASGWSNIETYTIIENRGGSAVQGTFGLQNTLAFFDASLDHAGNGADDVVLTLIRNDVAFDDMARNGNQAAAGEALSTLGTGNPLMQQMLGLPQDEVDDALETLSGEPHASGAGATAQTGAAFQNAANNRLRSAFGGVGGGTPFPIMGYGPGGPVLIAPDSGRFGAWAEMSGQWDRRAAGPATSGLRTSGRQFVVGADATLGAWRVGLLGGYGHTGFRSAAAFSGSADSWHLGVYGGSQAGALSLRAGFTHGWHAVATTRHVTVGGLSETLAADYDTRTAQTFGELGYAIETASARFEPFAGLAHVRHRSGGYAETGGAAALTAAAATADTAFTTLGLRAETDLMLAGTPTRLHGLAGWRRAFGDIAPTTTHAFAGGGAFTVAGAPLARDTALIEVGVEARLSPAARIGVAYSGSYASGATGHGLQAGFSARF